MTAYVALLRGVNVGGNKTIAMSDLRDIATSLGFKDVRTLLQSGNLVFSTNSTSPARLETLLKDAVAKKTRLDTEFFIRTTAEWSAIIEKNPFPDAAKNDPGRFILMLLKDAPKPAAVTALKEAIVGSEVVAVQGREAYAIYPDGMGRSRLTNAVIEKKLGTRATARNWNTVLKLDL
jgi:uncharacterized protein (DUF1697 family)